MAQVAPVPVVPGVALAAAHPFPRRVAAPPLDGDFQWLNTTRPISLADLRGKFVLIDFWTFCCINCMHVLPELKKLEQAYPNELVVIGVHSAKFEGEQDTDNIREAVLRNEIAHPVVNDSQVDDLESLRHPQLADARADRSAGRGRVGRKRRAEIRRHQGDHRSGPAVYRALGLLNPAPLPLHRRRGTADDSACDSLAKCSPTKQAIDCSLPTAITIES